MVSTSLCNICLRAGRKTRTLDSKLHHFLDELCDFALVKFDLQYCTECVHRLWNFYKFKQQCAKAIKVLKQWKKDKTKKKDSIHSLHTLLPQTWSLGIQDNNNVHFIKQCESQGKYCRTQNIPEKACEPQKTDSSSTKTTRILIVNIETSEDSSNFVDVSKNALNINENNVDTLLLDNNKEKESLLLDETEIKLEIDDRNISNVTKHIEFYDTQNITYIYEDFSLKTDNNDDVTGKGDDDDLTDICDDIVDNYVDKPNIEPKIEDTCNEKIVNDDVNDTEINITEQLSGNIFDDFDNWDYDDDDDDDDDDHINVTSMSDADDISDDDSIDIKRAKKTKLVKKQKRKKPARIKEPFSKEKLKEKLTYLFEMCKEVKSRDGTVLDRDTTLNNVDSWPLNTMKYIWKYIHVSEPRKPFPSMALKYLATLNKYGDTFEITVLDTEEEMRTEFLNRRFAPSYLLAPHKCEICYQGFKFQKRLEYHMKCHDLKNGDFECSVCKARESSQETLAKHKNASHRCVYKCKMCPLITNYSNSMVNHYHQHQGRQYKCKICSLLYTSQSTLNSHLMRHKTQHACAFCARTFVSASGLNMHRKRKHKGEVAPDAGVPCDVCDIQFVSAEVREKHRRVSHSGDGATLRRTRDYSSCRVCGAAEGGAAWLRTHMRTEHPDCQPPSSSLLCDVCGKTYSCKAILEQHRNVHTGARPFACKKCPKKFNSAQNLWIHTQRHLPPRWPCKECGKKFLTSANLYTHTRIHVGDRRFTCDACPATFLRGTALNAHVRGVHHQQRRVRKPQTRLQLAE